MPTHPLKYFQTSFVVATILALSSCASESIFGEDEPDEVLVDIVNESSTRMVYVSFNILPIIRPPDSQNELSVEGINPGEKMRFEVNCLLGETQYVNVRWENGSLRNYSISAPCGATVTYKFPQ